MTSSQTPDPLEGFTPMTDYPVMISDRWGAGKLRQSAKAAYDALSRSGEIIPQGVLRYKSGVVVVEYKAQLPPEWVHDLLGQAERRITGA